MKKSAKKIVHIIISLVYIVWGIGAPLSFVKNLANLNFEAVGALCADPDYKLRTTFLPNTKDPTLRLKLSTGVDSLKQSKVFVDRYRGFCNL